MRTLRGATLVIALTALASEAAAQSVPTPGFRQPGQRREEKPPVDLSQKPEKQFPLGSSWVAVSVNGKRFGGERPAFLVDKQFRARGFGGCNNFSATAYPLREQGIAVGPLALTKKQCDKAVMELERAFFVALRTSQKWDSDVGSLVLKSPAGEIRFERSI